MFTPGRSPDSIPVRLDPSEYLAGATEAFALIGESAPARKLRLQIDRIGPHFRTVLLQGEVGTGKESVARALHTKSGATAERFAMCDGTTLAESVTKAHTKESPWQPLLTQHKGTIYLDGVDELPLSAQDLLQKLLAASSQKRSPCPKIVAATTRSLRRMLGLGQFRADLYHRLATIEIALEPLRRRRDDIPALAAHIVGRLTTIYGRASIVIADEAMVHLSQYNWQGNLRELEDILKKGILQCDGATLESRHLVSMLRSTSGDAGECQTNDIGVEKLQEIMERHVKHVLHLCAGNKVRAAEMLGISRSTLYRMLEGPEKKPG